MRDILGDERFVAAIPIESGLSKDKKYCVTNADGEKFFLRIAPVERYKTHKALFAMLQQAATLGIPIGRPIEFGICAEGNYSLRSWIDGENLETALPLLPETEQYVLGRKAGAVLRRIHNLPAPENAPEWSARYFGVMDARIAAFQNCGIRFKNDGEILYYLKTHRHLLHNRPQSFRHGDYSVGNILLSETKEIAVIDWEVDDFNNYGDPWLDFTDAVWAADKSPHFASGLIKGYFGSEPPDAFWERLVFYVFTAILSSIQWVTQTRREALENEIRLCGEALRWFDNLKNPIPVWWLSGYEVWDILNASGGQTGRFHERGKPLATGDYHIVVHVWKHNGRGEWLIDRRSRQHGQSGMGDIGGKWETTGGCAVAGEDSLAAALRETREELGIDLDVEKGVMWKRTAQLAGNGHTWLEDVWIFEHDCPIEDVCLQESETCDAMWASVGTICEMIASGQFLGRRFYPYLDEMMEEMRDKHGGI